MEDRMEEVLQRVQFKFASIIGELCSEPLVLSQFAVWVDMRISEYKLKGSISLDCSGETPDPIWLKGITYALTQKLKHAQKEADSVLSLGKGIGIDRIRRPRAGGGQPSLVRNNSSGYTGNNQGIAIKDEPGEDNDVDVFPVDLYANSEKATESPGIGSKRKLPSSASVAQDSSVFPSTDDSPEINQPIHKLSRLSSAEAQAASAEPEHTSLLSIIGMDHSGQESGELTLQETDSDEISIILDNSSLQDVGTMQQGDSSLSQSSLQKNTSYDGTTNSFAMENRNSHSAVNPTSVQHGHGFSALANVPASIHTPVWPEGQNSTCPLSTAQKRSRDLRIQHLDRRQRSHIYIFERWLRTNGYPGERPFECLSPNDLDQYLANFFSSIRRKTGEDFTYNSLTSVRTSLARYFRDVGYPYSITGSGFFLKSQLAFRERVKKLPV
ncbi:uncharacterized protein LOC135470590 isoform X2 [Liolophura sinensis]|uniref:uncharacterized protein LOC135470590 isoform X2 n=1 Tax=Liolophura sinensis TaxID=3198878 RepID=UPI0031587A38